MFIQCRFDLSIEFEVQTLLTDFELIFLVLESTYPEMWIGTNYTPAALKYICVT